MAEKKILTRSGYEKVENELNDLTVNQRKEIAQKIKEAREQSDLSENAEYDAAKNEQAELEDRIVKLETMIRNAKIVTEEELTGDHVNLGLGVRVKDVKTKEEETYTIVGIINADPFNNKISNESPVGKALLGHKVGDVVDVETEMGMFTYKIMEIIR